MPLVAVSFQNLQDLSPKSRLPLMDKTFHVDNESARLDVLVSCHKILQACKPAKHQGLHCTMLKRPVELQSQPGYLVSCKKALTQRNLCIN